jgi:putative SOS response-associated peptidase YedK
MCGRYVLATPSSQLVGLFEADDPGPDLDWMPSYSVAPSQSAPVVREFVDDEGGTHRTLELPTWGLRPSWAKEKGPRPINARLETVATNGMFRAGFASGRCIVPMSGYYEWTDEPDGKQPHYLHSPGAPVLAAAGLTAARKDDETGEWRVSFTIITREARDAGGTVHDRMPVFLPDGLVGDWLRPGKPEDADALVEQLRAQSDLVAATMVVHPVSRRVNNVRTVPADDPSLVEPLEVNT